MEFRADVIELLEAVRTELDCERLAGARLAISDYWRHRQTGNGTRATDLQALELSNEIVALTPSDKSKSLRTIKHPRTLEDPHYDAIYNAAAKIRQTWKQSS